MFEGTIQDAFLNTRGSKEKEATFSVMVCPWKLLDGQSNSLGDFIESAQISQTLNWMILDNSLWKFESTDLQIFLQIIHTYISW